MTDKKHDDFDMTSGQLYEFTNKATRFVNSCSQDPRNEGYKIESSDPRLFARVEFCDGCGWAVNEGSDTYLSIVFDGEEIDAMSIDPLVSYSEDRVFWNMINILDDIFNPT
jgi:hypothetical protein